MEAYNKPLPDIYPWTAPFWEGAKNGKLMIQRGRTTGKLIMYPKKISPYDLREEIEWVEASGQGAVYSWSTVYANAPSCLAADVPFTVAIIDLDEGVRLCAGIVDSDERLIKIGARVEAVYQAVTDEITLVNFKVV